MQVPYGLIEAFHYSAADFNRAQQQVRIDLFFFVGREGHPLVTQQLATEAPAQSLYDNRTAAAAEQYSGPQQPTAAAAPWPADLTRFVTGDFPENMN